MTRRYQLVFEQTDGSIKRSRLFYSSKADAEAAALRFAFRVTSKVAKRRTVFVYDTKTDQPVFDFLCNREHPR